MMHGMGFRDDSLFCYWGRIIGKLKKAGYKIYLGGGDSCGSIESNAKFVAEKFDKILEETGAEKLNIIAHSKGGLEARYLASTLGYGEKIASITTLSTPHNGSKTVDVLMHFPTVLIKIGCVFTNIWFRILGDKKPDTYSAINSFKTASAQKFNSENPDVKGIYYQSYAFVMKHIFSDVFMWLPSLVVWIIEGQNDGLLTPDAAKWTNFRGVVQSNTGRGISHADEVDMRRHRLSKKSGDGVSDITDFYLQIVKELDEKGF